MRKVLIIGSGGAGKSTFAAALAARTGLPLVHLDAVYWKSGWEPSDDREWGRRVEDLIAQDAWILDGNYGGTIERRLAACDTVVLLDLPRIVCLWRVLKRRVQFRGRARPDMAQGCNERLSWEFLFWIWNYPKQRLPGILERLSLLDGGKRVVILKSASEVNRFLQGLPLEVGTGADFAP
jgi:adenylate kinase family enzyme